MGFSRQEYWSGVPLPSPKKAEHSIINAFELWCWKRLPRVPWTARWSNQSILKEINPEYSLEGLMLNLKLQCFGHVMWRDDSLEKTLILGKTVGRRRRGQQSWDGWMASPTQWTWVLANSERQWITGKPSMLQFKGSQRVGHNWAIEQQATTFKSNLSEGISELPNIFL